MSPDPRGPLLTGPRSIVGRVIGALVTVAAMVVGLMFSAVFFAVALVVGLVVWGWLWWKMRRLMRQAQNDPVFQQFRAAAEAQRTGQQPGDGRTIEGEVLHGEWKDEQRR